MLRRMRRNGQSLQDISVALGRSYGSIQRQIRYLGIQAQRHEPKPEPAPRRDAPIRAGRTTLPPLPSLQSDS
jgi:hypothetical protein